MPSGTGAPAPSRRRPRIAIARGSARGTTSATASPRSRPIERYGPTVCDGVSAGESVIVPILRRRGAPADDDVEAVAEGPVGLGQLEVEGAHEPRARGRVADRLEDRVELEQRIAREVHLRHEPLREGAAEERQVDVVRPP